MPGGGEMKVSLGGGVVVGDDEAGGVGEEEGLSQRLGRHSRASAPQV